MKPALAMVLVALLCLLGLTRSAELGVSPDGLTMQQDAHDDGCETPCPGEAEDGTCAPGCDDCRCCVASGFTAAIHTAAVLPVIDGQGTAHPALLHARFGIWPSEGRPMRVYYPPRSALS